MNPVEKLQAAIDKLESYRDDATQGKWVYDTEIGGEIHAVSDDHRGGSAFVDKPQFHDAWLIVTLHSTIPALLAILRDIVERYRKFPPASEPGWEPKAPSTVNALALATAILGES